MTAARPTTPPSCSRGTPLAASVALGLLLTGCGGGYGGGRASAPPPPAVSLSIAPTEVLVGQTATLTWSADGGATCTASDGWSGAEPASGTQVVTPTAAGTVNYTLTCTSAAAAGYSGAPASTARTVALTVTVPSAFTPTALVQDTDRGAHVDGRLVNPWGLAFGPTSPAWVANNHSGTATLYDGRGVAATLVVNFPAAPNGTAFAPTGVAFNGTGAFTIANGAGGTPASAVFLFAGESGRLAGWSPTVDRANAIVTYAASDGAIYKGLAVARDGDRPLVYATDFHNAKVDVFDGAFQKLPTGAADFAFADPALPAGYAPFGIAALPLGDNGAVQIVVTYAKQAAPDAEDDQSGPGLGAVDVYDTHGRLLRTLVAPGGALNAPWGLALAPADFGTLSNMLLVGNFGDGQIHGYEPKTGRAIGALSDASGKPFALEGLWGLGFGNDFANQPHATLFYTAGPGDEANGVYGRLDLGAVAPTLHAAPAVALTAPAAGNVSGTVTVTADVVASAAVAQIDFFANGASIGSATSAPFSVTWDTTKVANGGVALTARARDVDGNVDTSARVAVVVANQAAAAPRLSELQAQVFTPLCSGCHSGANPPDGALPASQNLTAGHSFASLVNVPSQEQGSLLRVKPGDPDNSYLVRKLEGAAGISGARMPLGGPFLDAATIERVRAWIAAGAHDD